MSSGLASARGAASAIARTRGGSDRRIGAAKLPPVPRRLLQKQPAEAPGGASRWMGESRPAAARGKAARRSSPRPGLGEGAVQASRVGPEFRDAQEVVRGGDHVAGDLIGAEPDVARFSEAPDRLHPA